MKKLVLSTAFVLSSLWATPNFANNTTTIIHNNNAIFAYCEISDPAGFYGKGNCDKVLAAYRAWKVVRYN